jgi:hypothetical protein
MTRKLLTGSPGTKGQRLGEAVLLVERTFHDRSFECAAWWQAVTCAPQTVEVTSNGYDFYFSFVGSVTAAHFPTMLAGVAVGAYDPSRDVGRRAWKLFHYYAYEAAGAIANGRQIGGQDIVTRLDPGVSVVGEYHVDIRPDPFFRFALEV